MHSELTGPEMMPKGLRKCSSRAGCRLSLGLEVVLATIVVVATVGAIGYVIDKTVDHVEPDQDQPIPESGTLKPVGSLVRSKGEQV
jgi:hypothetical protein